MNLVSRTVEEEKLYYFYNGHADVVALMDSAGTIQASYYYDSFGNHIEETGTVNNPYRYSGYQYDEETDNYYLNARYYDAKTARFLTEDSYRGTAADPLSLNVYTYVYNNPIKYWDPTGHFVSRIGNDVPIIRVTNNGQGGVTISRTETGMASADGVGGNDLRYTEISTSTTKTADTTVSTIKVTTVTDVTKKETTQTTTTNTSTNTTTTTVTTSDGYGYATVNTSSKTNTQKSTDNIIASEAILLASLRSDFLFLEPLDINSDDEGTNKLPTSGYELEYEPEKWNIKYIMVEKSFLWFKWEVQVADKESERIQHSTNCYAYALNLQYNPITGENFQVNRKFDRSSTGFALNPGELAGKDDIYKINFSNPANAKARIVVLAKADAEAGNRVFQEVGRNEVCPEGTYKVALVISKGDYHWYRQNPDGSWSHKQGATEVKNTDDSGKIIYDPENCDRGNYDYFAGYYAVGEK